jgi:hypothetical protein
MARLSALKSVYTRDGSRILLTHVCALNPERHVVGLETAKTGALS